MRLRTILGGVVAVLALAAVAVAVAFGSGGGTGGSSGVRIVQASETTTTPAAPSAPTTLTKLPKATVADGTAPVVLRLSGPVAPTSPTPLISPGVAGKWTTSGNLETFTPASTLEPCASYQITVWSQTTAVGQLPLGTQRIVKFAVPCPGTHALQQALARLHYLPYRFHARSTVPQSGRETRSAAARAAFKPPAGHFVRQVKDAPPLAAGQVDTTTRGALEVFQEDHGASPSGIADAATWASLLGAETAGATDRTPYTFVTVSQSDPETLEVHRGTKVVLKTPANTGVPGAPTQNGEFAIYERFTSTTMTGTNPDGSHYSDPGVPWVNYFNGGDAVHGFNRASYGFPQSDGCVELPPSTAATVYKMLAIGDIVTVSG
ncbi:MAG TPA: L,D-transpeptidase family protein [Solirubrobacteraceae bacterium]|jgi:lipoprotein-anchoring transpeptidase ErfK/SrfK|nr:L,D-transpeptidase family protein [Solirubrobacteraceae bacterium]